MKTMLLGLVAVLLSAFSGRAGEITGAFGIDFGRQLPGAVRGEQVARDEWAVRVPVPYSSFGYYYARLTPVGAVKEIMGTGLELTERTARGIVLQTYMQVRDKYGPNEIPERLSFDPYLERKMCVILYRRGTAMVSFGYRFNAEHNRWLTLVKYSYLPLAAEGVTEPPSPVPEVAGRPDAAGL